MRAARGYWLMGCGGAPRGGRAGTDVPVAAAFARPPLLTLESSAIPTGKAGCRRISAVDEGSQGGVRIRRGLHDAIRQDELAEIGVVESPRRFDAARFESGRLGDRVRVKTWFVDGASAERGSRSAAGPETVTDDFV